MPGPLIDPRLTAGLADAGWFNATIVIQELTDSADAEGSVSRAPATFGTVQAAITPLSGRELAMAQREQAEVNHRITMPFLEGVKTQMRVLFGTRIFEILVVHNSSERDVLTVLDCVELFELPSP